MLLKAFHAVLSSGLKVGPKSKEAIDKAIESLFELLGGENGLDHINRFEVINHCMRSNVSSKNHELANKLFKRAMTMYQNIELQEDERKDEAIFGRIFNTYQALINENGSR